MALRGGGGAHAADESSSPQAQGCSSIPTAPGQRHSSMLKGKGEVEERVSRQRHQLRAFGIKRLLVQILVAMQVQCEGVLKEHQSRS